MLALTHEKEVLYREFCNKEEIKDQRVLQAFLEVPREQFMPRNVCMFAYDDAAFPIGHGQSISQPYTVIMMCQWLGLRPGHKVLEIGTGSGYNAAMLSRLVEKQGKVITIETIPELYNFGKKNLRKYKNVEVILGDGSFGYEDEAPYDRIVCTAGSPTLLEHLTKQITNEGTILIPVNYEGGQKMARIHGKDICRPEFLGEFKFVPLRGAYGIRK